MAKILTIIIIFSFQSLTSANDISEFQIEDMSIGDNLLNYFTKQKLNQFSRSYGNDHNGIEVFSDVSKSHKRFYNLKIYDGLQVAYSKNSNNNYKIIALNGQIWFKNRVQECLNKRAKVIEEIKNFLGSSIINKNIQQKKRKHKSDKTGKSFTYDATFYLSGNNEIRVDCYDWSKSTGYWDHLRISVLSYEYIDLINRNYNK